MEFLLQRRLKVNGRRGRRLNPLRDVGEGRKKKKKSAEERLDVRVHQQQRLLSLKQEQFVHTGHF